MRRDTSLEVDVRRSTQAQCKLFLRAYAAKMLEASCRPKKLDWWVNAVAILIVLVLCLFLTFELSATRAADIEWLSTAARLLAYDKPL